MESADSIAAVAALADPVRRRLYDYVARSSGPVGRDAAAAAAGLPRSTAAFHLDRLVGAGLLEVTYQRLTGRSGPGAGRPAKLYRRAPAEYSVTLPDRHYGLAAELLATAVEAAAGGEPVADALARAAADAGAAAGDAGGTAKLPELLEDYGYEPHTDDDGNLTLSNCPFHRLSRRHTGVVCGMNRDFLDAVNTATGAAYTVVLDPAPGRCCVCALRRQSE